MSEHAGTRWNRFPELGPMQRGGVSGGFQGSLRCVYAVSGVGPAGLHWCVQDVFWVCALWTLRAQLTCGTGDRHSDPWNTWIITRLEEECVMWRQWRHQWALNLQFKFFKVKFLNITWRHLTSPECVILNLMTFHRILRCKCEMQWAEGSESQPDRNLHRRERFCRVIDLQSDQWSDVWQDQSVHVLSLFCSSVCGTVKEFWFWFWMSCEDVLFSGPVLPPAGLIQTIQFWRRHHVTQRKLRDTDESLNLRQKITLICLWRKNTWTQFKTSFSEYN